MSMQGDAPHSVLTGVPGWETEAEQRYLYELARQVPAGGTILEIGGEYGMSSSIFCLAAAERAQVLTVDLFRADLLDKHKANMAEAGFGGASRQIVGDSHLVGKTWDTPLNLLFIDGDHSYQGCLQDILLFTPHIVCGGLLVLHDCANVNNLNPHFFHFEVTRALSEWYFEHGREWRQIRGVDTILAFERLCPQE